MDHCKGALTCGRHLGLRDTGVGEARGEVKQVGWGPAQAKRALGEQTSHSHFREVSSRPCFSEAPPPRRKA